MGMVERSSACLLHLRFSHEIIHLNTLDEHSPQLQLLSPLSSSDLIEKPLILLPSTCAKDSLYLFRKFFSQNHHQTTSTFTPISHNLPPHEADYDKERVGK